MEAESKQANGKRKPTEVIEDDSESEASKSPRGGKKQQRDEGWKTEMSTMLDEHRAIWQKEIDANAKKTGEGLETLFNRYDKRCGERFKEM